MLELSDKYQQSGVIPYRLKKNKLQILLITSRKGKSWVVPKGIIEPDMTPQDSAAKEAFEEAGIRGTVSADLFGTYQYQKWEGTCRVRLYLMRVNEECDVWPESFRTREWLTIDDAIERIEHSELKAILQNLNTQMMIKSKA
jgi:8-oxo-dGTP pyrophosphatase MutT (NUDIX family)